jgi:hypothetical protein
MEGDIVSDNNYQNVDQKNKVKEKQKSLGSALQAYGEVFDLIQTDDLKLRQQIKDMSAKIFVESHFNK